jgi:hypothetical protein
MEPGRINDIVVYRQWCMCYLILMCNRVLAMASVYDGNFYLCFLAATMEINRFYHVTIVSIYFSMLYYIIWYVPWVRGGGGIRSGGGGRGIKGMG